MKNLFTNIIIALVFFTFGYMIYSSINKTNFEPIVTNKVGPDENINNDLKTLTEQKTVSELVNDKAIINPPEQSENIVEDIEIDHVNKDQVVDETELEEWSVAHKDPRLMN